MDKELIERLWRQAIAETPLGMKMAFPPRFAALVAEEAAKVCDSQMDEVECPERAECCAAAIRAKFCGKP